MLNSEVLVLVNLFEATFVLLKPVENKHSRGGQQGLGHQRLFHKKPEVKVGSTDDQSSTQKIKSDLIRRNRFPLTAEVFSQWIS